MESVWLALPQIWSMSVFLLSGRKGLTRKVAARNPAPMRAWKAIVKGRDFSGPSRETIRLASAVQNAPRARIWRRRAVTRTAKLEVKGRRIIIAPVAHIVTDRNTSLAQSAFRYSLKMKLVPRLPTM